MIRYLINELIGSFAASVSIIIVVIIYYNFSLSTGDEWRKSNVPFVRPLPIFGNTFKSSLGLENMSATLNNIYKRFSDAPICGFHQMRTSYLMIRDPELIKTVLIKDFEYFTDHGIDLNPGNVLTGSLFFTTGQRWKTMRQKMSPGFTSGKLKLMHSQIRECSEQMVDYIDEKLKTTDRLDAYYVMSKYATDVIGTCAFGLKLDSIKNEDSEFRKYGKLLFNQSARIRFVQMLRMFSPKLSKWLRVSEISPEALAFFNSAFQEVIKYREENNVNRNDVAQTLMQTRKELVLNNHELYAEHEFTETDIIGNAVIMFAAGADPVSDTLSFCLYELATNKQVQDKLRQHIYAVREKHRGEFSNGYLMDLHYADMVILETLRKCNGVIDLFRIATKDYYVPDHSLVIKKGQKIIIPTHSIHHDPKYYPNPDVFDPERFSTEEKGKRPNCTELFFGDGPRFCIGKRLAELEMKLGLSEIISKYEVLPCEKTEYPLKLVERINIKPKNGVWLSFKPINQ